MIRRSGGLMYCRRAHNTVMVDGMEQNQRGKSREEYVVSEPLPHTWITDEKYDYVSASYDFMRPSDEASHTYEAMFHLDADDAVALEDTCAVVTKNGEGESNLGIYALSENTVDLSIVSGQEEPTVQGWIPRGGPYQCEPIPTAVFKTEGVGPVVMSYVLCPMRAGEESSVTDVAHISATADNGRVAIAGRIGLRGDRAIFFAQSEAGDGWVRAGEGQTDGEACAVELAEGRVDRLIVVEGSQVLGQGKNVVILNSPKETQRWFQAHFSKE